MIFQCRFKEIDKFKALLFKLFKCFKLFNLFKIPGYQNFKNLNKLNHLHYLNDTLFFDVFLFKLFEIM